MFFANFRTTSITDSTTQANVTRWAMKFSTPNSKLLSGNTMEEFIETVASKGTNEVYFHDLDFAGAFIVQWLMKNGYEPIDILDKDADGKQVALEPMQWRYVCNEKSGIYIITVCFKSGSKVNFIDSWKTLSSSYEELKEAAGIKEDFDTLDLFDDFTQAKKDRIILREMEEEIDAVIYSFVKALSKYKKRLTRSSSSYDDFKDFYNKEHKSGRAFSVRYGGKLWNFKEQKMEAFNVLSVKDWNYTHKSFSGGYNAWKIGIENKLLHVKDGYVYDANAMHTSVSIKYKTPFGKLLHSKPLAGSFVELITVNIAHAKKKDPKAPNLIRAKNNRYAMANYVDEVEYEERTYWKEEWDYILKHYDADYYVVSKSYYRTEFTFKNWFENKAIQRDNYGDKVEVALDKGNRNGVIGKMGQGIKLGSKVIKKDGYQVAFITQDREYTTPKGEVEFVKKGDRVLVDNLTGEIYRKISWRYQRYGNYGEYGHETRFEDSEQRNHIGTASYIYWKARETLWNVIFNNLDTWLYSDSDSGFFSEMPRGIPIHPVKYGFWKPQNKFSYFKVLRGKAYMYRSTAFWKDGKWVNKTQDIAKVSGLNQTGKSKLNFDNFYDGFIVEDGKDSIITVDGGKIKYKQDFRLGKEGYHVRTNSTNI